MATPVIMVHGAFCGGWAFDAFRAPFEAAGHLCLTPDLPGHGRDGAATGASMTDYARAIVAAIEACETPPVVIGHSLGGLVAQMAAARTPVQSLILLAPSAPWGVASGSMQEAAAAIGLISMGAYWNQRIDPDSGLAHAYSLDRLAPADRAAISTRMVPESGKALWETFNWWLDPFMTTSVPASGIGAPVLAVAGGRDDIHPVASVRQTVERLGGELKIYPQMSHWLIGEPGWEEVAGHCVQWISSSLRAAA